MSHVSLTMTAKTALRSSILVTVLGWDIAKNADLWWNMQDLNDNGGIMCEIQLLKCYWNGYAMD